MAASGLGCWLVEASFSSCLRGLVGQVYYFIVVVAEGAPLNFNNQQRLGAAAFLVLQLVFVAGWLWGKLKADRLSSKVVDGGF